MRSHFRMLRVRKSINYHNGAMADATAAILEHFELGGDDVLILSNTVSHRLPRAVINLVMEELVRPFPDVFAVNGGIEEIRPGPGGLVSGWS